MTTDTPTRTLRRPSGGWELIKRVGGIAGILALLCQFVQFNAIKATLASLVAQVAPKQPGTPIVVQFSPFGWISNMISWFASPWTLVVVMAIGFLVVYARSPRRSRRSS